MLVVLILIGLITTLLLQGFFYVLHLRERFLEQLNNLQQGAIQEHWFRSSTSSLTTNYADSDDLFKGNTQQFSGLTLASLDADSGVPMPVTWQLRYENGVTALRYKNTQEQFWTVFQWQDEVGQFQYLSPQGEWQAQWPPTLGEDPPQLPRAIMLTGKKRQFPFTWIVHIAGRDTAPLDLNVIWESW